MRRPGTRRGDELIGDEGGGFERRNRGRWHRFDDRRRCFWRRDRRLDISDRRCRGFPERLEVGSWSGCFGRGRRLGAPQLLDEFIDDRLGLLGREIALDLARGRRREVRGAQLLDVLLNDWLGDLRLDELFDVFVEHSPRRLILDDIARELLRGLE